MTEDEFAEYTYDGEAKLSPLAKALDKAEEYGMTIISMKGDRKRVFSN